MVGCSAQQHSAADWQPLLEALVEFPSHREKRHPLSCLFPWQQYQGCLQSWSQELMQTEGVGFVFHLCQVEVYVPLHLRTLVLRCSAKCSEVRSGVTKGKRKLCERRMEDLFVLPSSLMSKKGKCLFFTMCI